MKNFFQKNGIMMLAAVTAFRDREGNPTRVDILRAMNRMSSMLYLLMIGKRADAGRGKER